jgi:hypothetical protein
LILTRLVLIMLLVTGWCCMRSPLWLAKLIDQYIVGDTDLTHYPRQYREFVAYVRQHPESWNSRYPQVHRAIRLSGWLAFTIFAVGVLMVFLASIGVAKVYS